jgi:hypothetical protein
LAPRRAQGRSVRLILVIASALPGACVRVDDEPIVIGRTPPAVVDAPDLGLRYVCDLDQWIGLFRIGQRQVANRKSGWKSEMGRDPVAFSCAFLLL